MQINVKLSTADIEVMVTKHLEANGMKLVKCEYVIENRPSGDMRQETYNPVFTGVRCEVKPMGEYFNPLQNTIIRPK